MTRTDHDMTTHPPAEGSIDPDNSMPLDRHRYVAGSPVETFLETLPGTYTKRERDALECILANAWLTVRWPGLWIAYSRDKNRYRSNRYKALRFRFPEIPGMVILLTELGYLDHLQGYFLHHAGEGKTSRFQATAKLRDAFEAMTGTDPVDVDVRSSAREPLILSNKNGIQIDYVDSRTTRRMRSEIEDVNDGAGANVWTLLLPPHTYLTRSDSGVVVRLPELGADPVTIPFSVVDPHWEGLSILVTDPREEREGEDRTVTHPEGAHHLVVPLRSRRDASRPRGFVCVPLRPLTYRRKFRKGQRNARWTLHGRWYAGLQQVPSKLRPYLAVDGAPTVEVDYRGTHPSILYAERGLLIPEDPYAVGGAPDVDAILGEAARNLWKEVAFLVLNSTSRASAERALRDARPEEQKEYYQEYRTRGGKLGPRGLIRAFEEHHTPIASVFFSGPSLRLMRMDAEITTRILTRLTAEGVPCLAIHDSYVVPGAEEERLRALMLEVWAEVVGGTPRLKVIPSGIRSIGATIVRVDGPGGSLRLLRPRAAMDASPAPDGLRGARRGPAGDCTRAAAVEQEERG